MLDLTDTIGTREVLEKGGHAFLEDLPKVYLHPVECLALRFMYGHSP